FLAIPLVAIFVEAGPGELISSLGRDGATEALWLSLKTSLMALGLIVVFGTPSAYLLARRRFRGRAMVLTVIELPLVLPRAAAGLASGLALAWGRALGEFGATLFFAGSLQGRTQTAPLAIFSFLARDFDASLALAAVLVLASAAILLSVKLLGRSPGAVGAP